MLFLLSVLAFGTPEATAAQAQVDKPKEEKKVCRKVETSSSRMAKRVCKTEADWANTDQNGRDAADLKAMGAR